MKPKRYLIIATHKMPDCVLPRLYKAAVNRRHDARRDVLERLGPVFNQKRGDVLSIDHVSATLYNAIDGTELRD